MQGRHLRAHLVFAVLLAFFGALGFRLFHIQARADEDLRGSALKQQTREETIPARRGRILSRDGETLAVSVPSRSAFAEPFRMEDPARAARRIAEALELDASQTDRLVARLENPAYRRFAWVRRQISDAAAHRLERLEIPGLGFREEYRRYYPFGTVAAQLIGFVDIDHKGLTGLERTFDETLTGRDGWRRVWRDALGRKVLPPAGAAEAPVDGRDVVLTIDTAVQCALENVLERVFRAHRPKAAIGLVMDPETGDILALAQRPSFDPNRPGLSPPENHRLRALTDTYEPGSTLKPLIAAACLEEGIVTLDEPVDCEGGAWRIGRRTLHDFHPYGVLPFSAVISKSSNIGMAKLGIRLGPEGLRSWIERFGLTERTGLPFPLEGRGRVTSEEDWTSYSTTSVPMGHEVAVTPVGLVRAYGALASGGILRKPRLVMRIEGPADRREFPVDEGKRVLSSLTARGHMGAALVSTVVKGTGKRAAIRGIAVGGKTGTAEVIGKEDEVVASFVGYAPAEDPEAVVLVLVEEPEGRRPTGGSVAAPAVRLVLKEALASRASGD